MLQHREGNIDIGAEISGRSIDEPRFSLTSDSRCTLTNANTRSHIGLIWLYGKWGSDIQTLILKSAFGMLFKGSCLLGGCLCLFKAIEDLKTALMDELDRLLPTHMVEPDEIGNLIEEVINPARQKHLKVDSVNVQELLNSHNQELTIDELIEMHEQDIEEVESEDPVQSENRMMVALARLPIHEYSSRKRKGRPGSSQVKKCIVPDDVRLASEGNHMPTMVSNYRQDAKLTNEWNHFKKERLFGILCFPNVPLELKQLPAPTLEGFGTRIRSFIRTSDIGLRIMHIRL
ncbi:hypothetical protein TNCV_3334921 [Trichonephila clavipes]|nr:hypothetical protein TNCV_3334921 [Trichonephila clavipes]